MTSAMMTRTLTQWGVALGLACLAGCQPTPAPKPPPDHNAMEQKSMAMRQTMMRADAGARVGVVETVLADQKWLAVGDVQVQNYAVGDWVSVFDPDGALLAQGEVRNINQMSLHVKYEPAANAPRAPQAGDVVLAGQRPARPMGGMMMDSGGMPGMMGDHGMMSPGGGMQPMTQPSMGPGGTSPMMNDHGMPAHDATPPMTPPATETPATPAPETPAAPAPTDTAAPQTPAPETPAPQAPAAETPAPATPAPETPAPAPEQPPEQNK